MAKKASKKLENSKTINIIAIVAISIFVASLAMFYFNPFGFTNTLYKVLLLLFGVVVAAVVFLSSEQGNNFKIFLTQTKIELRKVVWPGRDDTIKTTGIIIVMVIIAAIFLYLIDIFWTWIVSLLIN